MRALVSGSTTMFPAVIHTNVSAHVGFVSPSFKVGSSGRHSVSALWRLDWYAYANTSCVRKQCQASVAGWVFGYLEDTTTNTSYYGSHSARTFLNLTGNSIVHKEATNQSVSVAAYLTAGDVYVFVTYVNATAFAATLIPSSGNTETSDATFNMDLNSEGGLLLSVTVV
ncbi:MAG TPA: hypothetical protein VFF67_04135 [Thermoplasmata archaeon]|nr:hypothetical protein [Thermoplasmata archaeon]